MDANWILSNRRYHIAYKPCTKCKQPTSQSAPPPIEDPGLSQSPIGSSGSACPPSSTPAASSGGSGWGKMKSLRIKIQASSKRPKKVKQKSGIVDWMNDTVKSIAPSWLKKYFKKKDATEEEGVVQGTDQSCHSPPPPCPYCSEVGPPRLDGCDSPEPSTSSTEPSTSRASLNFQINFLSPSPMSPSPLPFSPLEASSPTLGASSNLLPPPPTSSAPGPVSTGFSLVKEFKGSLSQPQDDNSCTLCGFSSRTCHKDVPTSKTVSLPKLWSREMDKANSRPQPSWSSRNNLASNLSLFGTYSTLYRTALNSSQPGDSVFYPGTTRYGGRAASRSPHRLPDTPRQIPVRRPITAKRAGAQPRGVMSNTAIRILQSLESMSSPVASTLDTALNSSQLRPSPFYPGKTRYRGRVASRSPHRRPDTPRQVPVRRTITAKYAEDQPRGVTSNKAIHILQSLESMSSPDAKRIPNPPSPSMDGTNLDASHSEPKKKQSTLDTALNSSQPEDSAFYPGKTRYRGRAASRSPHRRPDTPCQIPVRRTITAKRAGAQRRRVRSNTAIRILQSLESMSSPDAKRIPNPPSPSMDGTNLDASHSEPKKKQSTLDTALNSSQIGPSPFYPGKTRYRGRVASRSPHRRPDTPRQIPVRRTITAKRAGAQRRRVRSNTAIRILQSLESMSSPDAKRIPNPPSPSMDGTNLDASHSEPKKKQSTLDTALNSSQLGPSAFYPGKTRYRGRVASRSPHRRPDTPRQIPVRRTIMAKRAGAQRRGVTSITAKRIMQSLQSMSSPVNDAKRIPMRGPNPPPPSMDGTNLDASHSEPKKKQSTLDTALNSSQIGPSPFYPGKTRYRGRVASRRPLKRPDTPRPIPVRRTITAKRAGAQRRRMRSNTAIRILQSLENMSSPDAKIIPIRFPNPPSPSIDGTNLDASHSEPKKKQMVSNLPPVQKLIVPDAASVSGNSSVYFLPILPPGGEGRNVVMTPSETPTSQSAPLPIPDPGPSHSPIGSSGSAYPLSSTPADSSGGEPADESETPFEEAPLPIVTFSKSSADSVAAPKQVPFRHSFGPAHVPNNTTIPTTSSLIVGQPNTVPDSAAAPKQVPFRHSFGPAPDPTNTTSPTTSSLIFGQPNTAPDSAAAPKQVPFRHSFGPSPDPTNTTSPTTSSLIFGQPNTAPDSAAAPKQVPFRHSFGPSPDPTNTTSPTTSSLIFGQPNTAPDSAAAPKHVLLRHRLGPSPVTTNTNSPTTSSLIFGQPNTAPDSAAAPKQVPFRHSFGPSPDPTNTNSPTTSSLIFGQPNTAPDSAAAPKQVPFRHSFGPSPDPTNTTSPTTSSLIFGQPNTAPDSAAAPKHVLLRHRLGPSPVTTNTTSPTTSSLIFGQPNTAPAGYSLEDSAAAPKQVPFRHSFGPAPDPTNTTSPTTSSVMFGQPNTAPDSAAAPKQVPFRHSFGPAPDPTNTTSPTTSSLIFGQPNTAPDSAAAPKHVLLRHRLGPSPVTTNTTSPTTSSLIFGQPNTAPDSAAAPKQVPFRHSFGPAPDPTNKTSPTTSSLIFGQPNTAPDSAAAPKQVPFRHSFGPSPDPTNTTSPTTSSLIFGQPNTAPDSAAAPKHVLLRHRLGPSPVTTNTTSPTTSSLIFGQPNTAPDSAAAPKQVPFRHSFGPAPDPTNKTSPTTSSLIFGQPNTAPDSAAAPKQVPFTHSFGPSPDPTNTTSPTTGSLIFGQPNTAPDSAAAPKHVLLRHRLGPSPVTTNTTSPTTSSLIFGQPNTAPDSAAAPKQVPFRHSFGPSPDPTNTTSPTTSSLIFGQPNTAPDSAAAPKQVLFRHSFGPSPDPTNTTSPTTSSLIFGQPNTAPAGGLQFERTSPVGDPIYSSPQWDPSLYYHSPPPVTGENWEI